MTNYSPIGQYPYPSLSDIPNINSWGQSLTSALDLTTLPRFSSASAMNTQIPSPTNGQQCLRTDVAYGTVYTYSTALARWVPEDGLISELVLSSAGTSVTFSSIPQDWRNLRLITWTRANVTTNGSLYVEFNGDTGSNYDYQYVNAGPGATIAENSAVNTTGIQIGNTPGTTYASGVFGIAAVDLPAYTQAGGFQSLTSQSFIGDNSAINLILFGGLRKVAAATTSITVYCGQTMQAGCRFSLYGMS